MRYGFEKKSRKAKENRKKEEESYMPEMKSNVIFIGKKPATVYAMSVMTQAQEGQDEIHLQARGRAISTAVDVSQLSVNRFCTNYEISDVKIGTEEIEVEDRRDPSLKSKLNVSSIDITLKKKA